MVAVSGLVTLGFQKARLDTVKASGASCFGAADAASLATIGEHAAPFDTRAYVHGRP